jgi:subtilase family serine protease
MRRSFLAILAVTLFVALLFVAVRRIVAQSSLAPSRITAVIDETKLAVLRGNTHPLARSGFDRGLAPDSLPMEHMLMVLQRSAAQQAALDQLLAEQQDRTSPNYHKWLKPDEFGQQFGASDVDIAKITAWLQAHGFTVDRVAHGRNLINFSGTAGQVREAFHTAIHQYVVNNENHWANASDPEIPVALTPVVAGIRSLHNFFPKGQRKAITAQEARAGEVGGGRKALFTFPPGCTPAANCNIFGIGPADFAKIYNVPSTVTGNGVTIAVVSASDVNSSDLTQFRSIFSLPAMTINSTGIPSSCAATPCFTQVIAAGSGDPGVVGPSATSKGPDGDEDEVEAILDVEWSGAVANLANIDLVSSADSNSNAGIDLSAEYIVDTMSPTPPILSESYGVCELGALTSGNAFYNSLWSQAATEGITVLVSSGDNGSAACDAQNPSGPPSQPAQEGLQLNAIASTPYDVAVGGTDLNDPNPFLYFTDTNNGTTGLSALSYIPESTWNDTCTNSIVYGFFGFSTAEGACNDTTVQDDGFVAPIGGSGGVSSCTGSNGVVCTSGSGYAKPSWQTGTGVPLDGKRDVPDVSLFGSTGTISGTSYIDCEADFPNSSNQPSGPCSFSTSAPAFLEIGGTSASTQALAGVMALLVQNTAGMHQGNANPMFYALAAKQSAASCNSNNPASTCVFHDVTVGTNTVPCVKNSPNCTVTVNSDTVGLLTVTSGTTTVNGYNAGTGYDLATGLGTPNVANLLGGWGPNFYISPVGETATVSGNAAALTLTAYGVDGFSGTITGFSCSNLPSGASCTFACPTNEASCTGNNNSLSLTLSPTVTTSSVDVTVTTASGGRLTPTVQRFTPTKWNLFGVASLITVLLGILWASGTASGRNWKHTLTLMLLASGVAIGLVACSGKSSSSSSTTGNTIVTVSATSGGSTTSTTFNLAR